MLDREIILKQVASFKTRYGVQDQDEHIITTIHLMNTHRIDLSSAQDQTSHGANDHGIDGWHYDPKIATLFIYQSKLTENKATALNGFGGLLQAGEWISTVLRTGDLGGKLSNAAIYNLARCLDSNKGQIRTVLLYLITPFNPNELLDCADFDSCQKDLVRSTLNAFVTERGGGLNVQPEMYNLTQILPSGPSSYVVTGLSDGAIQLGKRTQLQVLYFHLASLVELFRRRGNRLFEKNVRLYLNTKESRVRLEHPLEDTLERICSGNLEPHIFPFYHIGVTITAGDCQRNSDGVYSLETPNIINGCQTVNIAERYLKKLEKEKAVEKVGRFRQIPVLAKVVISATDEQIREIANCNNRQNPIDAWQLFSNDPVHVLLEVAFQEKGIFYERQKGKFDAEMRYAENLNRYHNTNRTKITVEELGQLITLCRRQLQVAAKPSEIFASKAAHDQVFDWNVPERHIQDAVWAFNAFKAVKTGLKNYLRTPAHDNEITHGIFVKPIVRHIIYYAAMMHLYQRNQGLAAKYGYSLNKKAPAGLILETDAFFRRVVTKSKGWYLSESQQLRVEVAWKKLNSFLDQLCHEAGLDSDGIMPFKTSSLDWSEFEQRDQSEII
ncbi:MAG TPA: AIPR family protein [Tepidisphaeraceae bacterium]|nr:AIPR family protein [Tepidisphaeraceae bacterium]